MTSKYEFNMLDIASKLDAMSNSCGEISKCARDIVLDHNENSIIVLVKKMSDIAESEEDTYTKEVKLLTKALKDSLIELCGYLYIKKIVNVSTDEDEDHRSLDDLLKELQELVGLDNVKQEVQDLIAFQRVQKLRELRGFHVTKSTLHMAFTGNPGTGKTTVARIVGHIYKQIGLLSKGHFVEVSRTDLIAGYQGQTALKVKAVIERAKGGVLFIDEAYSITENDHSDSYGRECLTELTKALEDYRDNLVVIVAGYTEPMNKFFESNPGLKSRFNTFIRFKDYTEQELLEILEIMCKQNDYKITDKLKKKLRNYFIEKIQMKDEHFANGRLARNIYDDLIMNHAKRIVNIASPTNEDLSYIKDSDFFTDNEY